MKQTIVHIALVVRDYDEAIAFYTKKLHFTVLEDTYQPDQDKRWVVVAPPGTGGTTLLLAKASKPEQMPFIGDQAGARVFLFLNTDNFWRDYREMTAAGIEFIRGPKHQDYGTVAVFKDLYGNLWDLLELNQEHPILKRMNPSTGNSGMTLRLMDDMLGICRMDPDNPIPTWMNGGFFSVTRTSAELSVVCLQRDIPDGIQCERDWRMFKVDAQLDFSLTGILSSISKVLADAEISLFALSTFDTDYILVKAARIDHACIALSEAGYNVLG